MVCSMYLLFCCRYSAPATCQKACAHAAEAYSRLKRLFFVGIQDIACEQVQRWVAWAEASSIEYLVLYLPRSDSAIKQSTFSMPSSSSVRKHERLLEKVRVELKIQRSQRIMRYVEPVSPAHGWIQRLCRELKLRRHRPISQTPRSAHSSASAERSLVQNSIKLEISVPPRTCIPWIRCSFSEACAPRPWPSFDAWSAPVYS